MLRFLIFLELLCLLGPAIALLFYAWWFAFPVLIASFWGHRFITTDEFLLLVMVFGGSWGMVSLSNLSFHLLHKQPWAGTKVQWFGLVLGVLASAVACFVSYGSWIMVIFLLPMVALVHLLVLQIKRTSVINFYLS